jgi:uncharacterized membrane protein YkoI
LKKSLAILALVIVAGLVGAVLFYGNDYKHDNRPVILDLKKHNEVMGTCIKTALEKHPGAIVEIEMEKEDGRPIFDIDIQGADGKHWEIECDAELATIIEDSIDKG